jgi:hypothetical protein
VNASKNRTGFDDASQFSAGFPRWTRKSSRAKVGTKWHGYIAGRPDLDETALTEEAVHRKMEQLRDRIGACGAKTNLFGGRTCELIAGHHELGEKHNVHRCGSITWFDVSPDDPRDRERVGRAA